MESFGLFTVTDYNEGVFRFVQQSLNKVNLQIFGIKLRFDVTEAQEWEICFKLEKELFKLETKRVSY